MPSSIRYRLDSNDRELKLERARQILGIEKDRWKADVLDAAIDHLIESHENLESVREELDPVTIQKFNTHILKLRYRTSIETNY